METKGRNFSIFLTLYIWKACHIELSNRVTQNKGHVRLCPYKLLWAS